MTVSGKEEKLKMVPFSTCTHNIDLPGTKAWSTRHVPPYPWFLIRVNVVGKQIMGIRLVEEMLFYYSSQL